MFSITACQNQNTQQASGENVNVDPATAPVFSFKTESYDFGEINEGDKVSYNFDFTNTGKGPLTANTVTGSQELHLIGNVKTKNN